MGTVRSLLERGRGEVAVRPLGPGDLGWIIQRNGELYADEYGWDSSYEALVAAIVADFAARPASSRERGWIAEVEGRRAGCVLCVQAEASSPDVAKLRLLLVEPSARGYGVGRRLVAECVDFARTAGYRQMVLWTQSILIAARHIYTQAGFELVESAPHRAFGADLVEETWSLDLHPAR
jgi:GNAT superfamily N-acetyltransferase